MGWLRPLRDGRVVAQPMFDPARTPPWRVGDDPGLERDLASMRSTWRRRLVLTGVVLAVLSAVVMVALQVLMLLRGSGSWHSFAVIGFFVPWGVFMLWASRQTSQLKSTTELIDAYLRVGRCPSCAYKIAGLDPEQDGGVVCPECASAWRPSRNDTDAGV